MRHTWLRYLPVLMLLPLPTVLAQTLKQGSFTKLQSSSATLQLPGSLTLTSTVTPSKETGGMPSGTVQFFNNATHSLGTAPLKAIPGTQNFSAPAINGNFGNQPFGLFTLPSGSSNSSILGLLDFTQSDPASGIIYPQLSIYSGQGASLFQSSTVYPLTNPFITGTSPGVDAYALGDFNHNGTPGVLIHGYNTSNTTSNGSEYYVVLPLTAGTFAPTTPVVSPDLSGIGCDCSNPTQVVAVDDFDGDGYADVAYTGNEFGSGGQTGVAINTGAGAPGSFTTFVTAPAMVQTVSGETFTSTGIATGHFTSSGRPDIAVVGSPSTGTTGYVALYLNQGVSGGTLSFAAPTLFNVGFQPSSIATADFRANGMTDVVVTNLVPTSQSGSVQVLFGDGKGNLNSSSTVAIGIELSSVSVADFNNDGYPDILAAAGDGELYLLLNDKTGHFGTAVPFTTGSGSVLTAIGDFNGDGLADIADVTRFGLGESGISGASEFLNSASSQATLVTAAQTLPAGTDTLTAEFPGDTNFNTSTSTGVPITVTQTPSSLTWAQPTSIGYGTALSAIQLNATASVAGTITYSPAAGTVLHAGQNTLTATFVPTDAFDYAGATATRTITVTQGSSTLTWAQPTAIVYGTELSVTQLNATASVAGTIRYSPATGTVLGAGPHTLTATFVPTDAVDYTGATATRTLTVTQKSSTLTWGQPASIVYGTALSATQLNATASAAGTITYSPATGIVLHAGPNTLTATFVPTDAVDYTGATATRTLTVTQESSILTWAQPASIVYGTALSATQLNATASFAGTITYTPAAGTVLHAGSNTLTATFVPTDAVDYAGATTTRTITVTEGSSTLIWAQPAAMEYGTPLSATQLNATSSVAGKITYAPSAGTVLLPGATPVTATLVPTDAVDNTGATATRTITVNAPTLTGISPSSGKLGDADTTIVVNGQGLVRGAVVQWNATALSTTWVNLNQLTAVIPASLLAATGTATITVADPNKIAVTGLQSFVITASAATASASAEAKVEAGQDASVTLTVSPYPAAITATLTLEFAPAPPNTVTDPAVLFPNNTTTDVVQIPANNTAAIPAIDFATGSTAGTITLTIKLTASGVDITPATLTPITVVVPPAAPVINSVTLDRTGNTLNVAVLGLSSTRDMTQATFHFTAAAGASLKTTDLTVDLTTAFTGWYQSTTSDTFGTTFLYTQPFTLTSDATDVGSVTVTLTNSQGASQPGTAQ
jgi:hypothetical protein